MNRIVKSVLAAGLLASGIAVAQVPSLINYQGRLTDADGAAVTGTKNFSISIFDAATGGNLLYTETIGAVTLDDNGVYSFQFGGIGTSNTQVTETVASTDGTATTFQKVLANSPVVTGSVSVSDGTYTWSPSTGSSNEDDFGVAYSTSLRRVTVSYYNGAPAVGGTITATYRYGTSGITGALSSGAEHWMAVSVDGTAQGIRQRVLAVPFAAVSSRSLVAEQANSVNETGLFASTSSISSMLDEIALSGATTSSHRLVSVKDSQNALISQYIRIPWVSGTGLMVTPPKISTSGSAGWESKLMGTIENINCKVSKVKYTGSTGSSEGHTEVVIIYQDGSTAGVASRSGAFSNVYVEGINPNPIKIVSKIEFRGGNNRTGGGTLVFSNATFEFAGSDLSFTVSVTQPMSGTEFIAYLDQGFLAANPNIQSSYTVHSGSNTYGPYTFGEKFLLPSPQSIDSVNVLLNGSFADGASPITKILLRKIR